MTDKVIVAVSGGVDSSVAAWLLVQQGHEVEALFMKNWDETGADGSCLWEAEVEDAMQVCERLGIRLNTVDLSAEYWTGVFESFIAGYREGRTPNPDVLCNQEVKFRAFLEHSIDLGASFMATGHYARIEASDHGHLLLKGRDRGKDQSYFLCRLDQAQLSRSMFPVGGMRKADVRALAARAGFVTHDKKDSTGICFVGERPFRAFLSRYIPARPGQIQTAEGQVVGEHEGAHLYTVGQRQGLKIGGVAGRGEAPWYVADKDLRRNLLIVVQGSDHPLLFSKALRAREPHWLSGEPPSPAVKLAAKLRYRQADQDCSLSAAGDGALEVRFREPQRAVAPGQYIVFYDGETCLGSAIIEAAIH